MQAIQTLSLKATAAVKASAPARRSVATCSGKGGGGGGYTERGGNRFVYNKQSNQAGSVGSKGQVYKLKGYKGNVDEYSPIYQPDEWKAIDPLPGKTLALWLATLGGGALAAIYLLFFAV